MSDSKGLSLPSEHTKFLVFNDNPKYLSYVFGKAGIYVENITPIGGVSARGIFQRPTIVKARFDSEKQISLLLTEADKQLNIRRIFKSVGRKYESKDKIDGFINNCARNLVNLAKGKTIRIQCKDNKLLQQKFYVRAIKWNEQDKTNCKFDFDEYSVEFNISEYTTTKMQGKIKLLEKPVKHWVITTFQGLTFSEKIDQVLRTAKKIIKPTENPYKLGVV